MSKINNWAIKNDITYYVEEDTTYECGYLDGDGRGDGYSDGYGFVDGDGIGGGTGDGCGFVDGDGTGDGRANIHGYGGRNKL